MDQRLTIAEYAKSRGIAPGRYSGVEAASIRKGYEAYSRAYDTKLAQSQAESSFTPAAVEVQAPWGGTLKMAKTSPNSAQLIQDKAAWEPIKITLEDGTPAMMDRNTLAVVKAWDATTGKPVKEAKKVDPFAGLLGGAPQPAPVGQSGAAMLEAPVAAPAPQPMASPPASAPAQVAAAPAQAPAQEAPKVYEITGEADYAKVPAGATVSWNGQTFTKR